MQTGEQTAEELVSSLPKEVFVLRQHKEFYFIKCFSVGSRVILTTMDHVKAGGGKQDLLKH